jgi:hypothetical protein
LLTKRILDTGRWPSLWTTHCVVPLYKKRSVFVPENYRGIHVTAQLSKVVERLIKRLQIQHLESTVSFGPNQFAYTVGRGARDALALLLITWLKAVSRGRKIGVYCSDVAGAFDRVSTERLLDKLRSKKLRPEMLAVIASWLRQRTAHVVVGGKQSDAFAMNNMVYQGTVLGPILWNVFYEDARKAVAETVHRSGVR